MKPGDEVTAENGMTFRIGPMLAYQGKDGCRDARCRRMGVSAEGLGKCIGYHCPVCDEPCSSMGHKTCQEEAA